jgi:hypothetical protein
MSPDDFKELDELKEKLEEEYNRKEDKRYDHNWDQAKEKYGNGDTEHLGLMIESKARQKALEYKGFLSKKGQYLDYDEWHTLSASATLIGLAYILHPIVLALWVYLTKKIFDHSLANCKHDESEHVLETLDMFGMELWYYIGGAFVSAWFFETFTVYSLRLENGGTLMTLVLEVLKLFAGI